MRHLSILFFAVLSMCISTGITAEESPPSPQRDVAALTLEQTQEIMPANIRNKGQEPHIALILPLKSIPFWQDAEAVKQGFFAATQYDAALSHDAGGHEDLPIRVYECEEEGRDLPELYAQAVSQGAVAVVGGLTFRGFNALAKKIEITVPTLTLNVWKNTYRDVDVYKRGNSSIITKVADNFEKNNLYFFGLSPEDEARLVAQQALKQGLRVAIIIVGKSSGARRLGDAFYREYVRVGARAKDRIIYTGDPSVFYRLRVPSNATVFLATNGNEAKEIIPLLPKNVPIYATSRIFDHRADNKILANVRFADMPWIVHADDPMAFDYPKPNVLLTPEHTRLYALGIDAYTLVRMIIDSLSAVEMVSEFEVVNGVSGTIKLVNNVFNRSALSVTFSSDGGVAYDNPPPPVRRYIPRRLRAQIRAQKQKTGGFVPNEVILETEPRRIFRPVDIGGDQADFPREIREYRSIIPNRTIIPNR